VRAPALPAIRRSVDDIVQDIVAELGPDVETAARAYIGAGPIMEKLGPAVGNRRTNAKLARTLLKWIGEGESLFDRFDGAGLIMLFAPPVSIGTPEVLELAVKQAQAWRGAWIETLRARCEWIIQAGVGEHGHVGHMQRVAAVAAAGLCRQAGKPLHWAAPISAFCVVATLIYEAMTGEPEIDIQRACEFVADQAASPAGPNTN
jgi:hypothetical protein